jgi:hypothetical protein
VVARRFLLPAAAVAVGLLVAAGLVALALRDGGDETAETPREALLRPTVRASLEPEVHAFGERVTVRLELLVRKPEIQLSTLRPAGIFDPYQVVGSPRREEVDLGALHLVRYTITLQCLRQTCLPRTQIGEVEFPPGGFTWRTPPPPGRRFRDRRLDQHSASEPFPTLKVASRLTERQLQDAAWRSNLAELPSPTFRISPDRLAAGLLGGSAVLVLLAAVLVGGYVSDLRRRRAEARLEGHEAPVPPLERALALVVEANGDGDVDAQRIALETLASELREQGELGLARDAERLAWSPDRPVAVEVDRLAETVRRLNGAVA